MDLATACKYLSYTRAQRGAPPPITDDPHGWIAHGWITAAAGLTAWRSARGLQVEILDAVAVEARRRDLAVSSERSVNSRQLTRHSGGLSFFQMMGLPGTRGLGSRA
jgi:hypothetical protein